MTKTVRPVRATREAMSSTALEVLHVLEPVLGRIIATAVLKYACGNIGAEIATLTRPQLPALLVPIERSLAQYDRLAEVGAALRQLAGTDAPGERSA